jgi:thiamine biosynthesis lipoprotein
MNSDQTSQKTILSRRQFLKIVAIGGAALTTGLILGFGNDIFETSQAAVIRETHLMMNGVVNLTLVSDDPAKAKAACDACVREMRRRVDVFNRFDPKSQLSQLNAEGRLKRPDSMLVNLLNQSELISRASAGAFDISIKPLLDLYLGAQAMNGGLPSMEDVLCALRLVDYKKIVYAENEIGFSCPEMSLTLDGIAKGAVVDAGVVTLRMRGFDNVIVEAAGDLLAAGERNLQVPWKIGIRPPRDGMIQPPPVLHIKNRAVATSGDYLQAFTTDYSIHHILDPHRGFSSSELSSATVIAPSASLADGLATAIMVLGVHDGLELLKSFPGCEAYLIDKQLLSTCSPGMGAYFSVIL